MLKQLLKTIITSFITSLISCSMFFLFLSIFIFNLEIQNFSGDYMNIKSKISIVQVDDLTSNLHAYFIEDCPFICIPDKK